MTNPYISLEEIKKIARTLLESQIKRRTQPIYSEEDFINAHPKFRDFLTEHKEFTHYLRCNFIHIDDDVIETLINDSKSQT